MPITFTVDHAKRPDTQAAAPSSPASYAMVLVCFTLALMAKPMVMTLPLVLLLLDYWLLD